MNAPTRLTGTIDHQPAVCPPNLTAMCVCGDELQDHYTVHVNYAADGNAQCPRMPGHTFELIGGDTLDCPDATDCDVCGVAVCNEHSDQFTTCVDSRNVVHHTDCADLCRSCSYAAGEDHRAELRSDR